MKAITLFNGEGIHSIETCIELSKDFLKWDREALKQSNVPKWFLSEIYGYLKSKGDLPDVSRERKLELWNEAKKDKLLYLSLYLIEVI